MCVLFGKGLAAFIGERQRIEMNYLELLYKQGLPGVGFWLVLLFINFMAFRSVVKPKRQQALAFC